MQSHKHKSILIVRSANAYSVELNLPYVSNASWRMRMVALRQSCRC